MLLKQPSQPPFDPPFTLDPEQLHAVELILTASVGVITGGAGCGKSTVCNTGLDQLDALGRTYALCAPTGKAARRLSEVTGRPATTIHRLLEWLPTGFQRGAFHKLSEDVICCDESSMLDVNLAAALISAVDFNRTRIIFIGDANQLPPVGPGAFFRDLIASAMVPTVRLLTLHRAAQASWIYRNGPKVLTGAGVELDDTADFEWWQLPSNSAEYIVKTVVDLVRKLKNEGVPLDEVQVLTPMKERAGGTGPLNKALQAVLNPRPPGAAALHAFDQDIYRADKVIHIRNNYELGVMNGEVGYVLGDVESHGLRVKYPGDVVVRYSPKDARDLLLAYALTVHKCVAEDTLVCTRRGVSTIAELSARKETDGFVLTDQGLLPYHSPFLRRISQPCLKLRTKDGYELVVTPDHRLMAWCSDHYELVRADALEPGQFLRLCLDWDFVGKRGGVLPELGPQDVRAVEYQIPTRLVNEVAEFLGLMVAGGTVYRGGFRLVKRHMDTVDRFQHLCEILFGATVKRWRIGAAYAAEVNSTALSGWFLSIGGLGPNAKAVPSVILEATASEQAHFLRGLFEDGTVNVRGKTLDHVEWGTCFERMSITVQTLLLRFGIISSRRKVKNQYFVYIYGKNATKFGFQIGFINKFNMDRVKYKTGLETKYMIPVSRAELTRHTKAELNGFARGAISRHAAEQIGRFKEHLRFHHSPLASVQPCVARTGCLTVPNHGRFLQNGFDGANCQGSQFRNVVVVCHSEHAHMLTRQLLYTAITRAKEKVYVVGDVHGMKKALATVHDSQRRTLLQQRLRGEM